MMYISRFTDKRFSTRLTRRMFDDGYEFAKKETNDKWVNLCKCIHCKRLRKEFGVDDEK